MAAVAGPVVERGVRPRPRRLRVAAEREVRMPATSRRSRSMLRRHAEAGLQRLIQGGGQETDGRPLKASAAAKTLRPCQCAGEAEPQLPRMQRSRQKGACDMRAEQRKRGTRPPSRKRRFPAMPLHRAAAERFRWPWYWASNEGGFKRGLTFELSGPLRQDGLARVAKMYCVPPTGPRRPAVAGPRLSEGLGRARCGLWSIE